MIIEETLGRTTGHFESWIDGIAGALRDEGLTVTVVGSLQASRLPGGQRIQPWFPRNYLDAYLSASPRTSSRMLAAFRHNLYFFRRARSWFAQNTGTDLVMVTHVNVFHLLAWRLLWMVFGRRKIRRLVLNSLVPMWLYEYDDSGMKRRHKGAGLVGFLYRSFAGAVQRGEVLLTAETEHDANEIEAVSGVKVATLPTPRPQSLIAAARRRLAERRSSTASIPVLGWLGRCSDEKGFSTFFHAVEALLRKHPRLPCTVLLQYLVGPDGCTIPESEVNRLATEDGRVRLLKKSAQGDDYGTLLGELDCLVLPYLRRNYVGRNSSAALDAVLAGIPIVTTEGTWMADFMTKHGAGLECPDQDAAGLAEVMHRFLERFAELTDQAWMRGDAARSAVSWKSFAQVILK